MPTKPLNHNKKSTTALVMKIGLVITVSMALGVTIGFQLADQEITVEEKIEVDTEDLEENIEIDKGSLKEKIQVQEELEVDNQVRIDKDDLKEKIRIGEEAIKQKIKMNPEVEKEVKRPWDGMPQPNTGDIGYNFSCKYEIDYEGGSMRPLMWEGMEVCAKPASKVDLQKLERGMIVGAETPSGSNVVHMVEASYIESDGEVILRGINNFERNEYTKANLNDIEFVVTKLGF